MKDEGGIRAEVYRKLEPDSLGILKGHRRYSVIVRLAAGVEEVVYAGLPEEESYLRVRAIQDGLDVAFRLLELAQFAAAGAARGKAG